MPIKQLKQRQSESWRNYQNPSNPGIKKKKSWRENQKINWRKLVSRLFVAGLILLAVFVIYAMAITRNLPNPNQLIERAVAQSTKIYDRTGENILYEIHGEQRRTLIPLNEMPSYVKEATISIEDKNFYKHGGFSLWAMFRTAITNVLYNRRAGGSTLTQQFIKNAVLTPEKKITRKIKELVLAYRLEKRFSKDEILQMYLNEIPYGSNAYGVEAASQKYFGQSVKNISLAEAAVLAAMTQAPSRYSPYGPNKDLLLGRKDYVLSLMVEQGYISTEERDQAQAEEIEFKGPETNITAPHFVMYIKGILAEKYGEKMIEQEGLKIYTTLDLYKQKIAEEVIKEKTEKYQEKYKANNAALVAIDPKTGQILAMVGSRDYFNDEIDGQVNVATRPRQPGSSMKPIVYAALFEKGYSPETILYDTLTNFSTDSGQPYEPRNYNGKEYGPVSIRQALAGSLNIPAVKAIYLAGINNVIDLAEKLGYSTLYPRDRFGLALVLGGAEVKLLEHTNAYSAFARDGETNPAVGILKVEDKEGKILEEYKAEPKRVISSQTAREINSVLSDNGARAFIFGAGNYLNLGERPVAAKTGTTNDYHDAWTIGYTPSLVAGVWVGNSNNDAMAAGSDGSVLAAPIWHDFMSRVLGDTPKENFTAPEKKVFNKPLLGGEIPSQTVLVDQSTGQLADNNTPPELIGEKSVTVHHSILFYVDKDDPLGPQPKNPEKDPQFQLWEGAVKRWAEKNASSTLELPDGYGQSGDEKDLPFLEILSPEEGETISVDELEVVLDAGGPRGLVKTEYYLNGNLWLLQGGESRWVKEKINFLNNGYHTLSVKVCDDLNNCREKSLSFNLKINNNPVGLEKNSLSLNSPSSGTSLNNIDFPLNITFQISFPIRSAKLLVWSKNLETGALELIGTGAKLNNQTTSVSWEEADPGNYALYGELRDWMGGVIKSNEITLLVN